MKLVSVKGKVTVGGSAPFKNGLVVFVPQRKVVTPTLDDKGGKPNPNLLTNTGGSAVTDDQGNFSLRHTTLKSGIEPGDYHVFFSLKKMPDGSPVPDQSKERDPKTPDELGAVEFVPPDLSTMQSTKNPVTVSESGGTFTFNIPELQAQPRARRGKR